MSRLYGYNVGGGSPWFASEADWEKQMTADGAKAYLNDHLKPQLTRDVPVAIKAFVEEHKKTGVGVGFYAGARIILLPISFLGALYRGADNTDNSVDFLEDFAGRTFQPKYLDFAATIFVMYRHGLTHAAMPKIIERADGVAIGWGLSLDEPGSHLTVKTDKANNSARLIVSIEQMYEDTLKALDHYVASFDGPDQALRLEKFKIGYATMAKVEKVNDLGLSKSMKLRLEKSLTAIPT